MTPKIPPAALVLGLAGLLPFAFSLATQISPGLADATLATLGPRFVGPYAGIAYGIVILSFMSGVLWGFAARATRLVPYALSVLPALWTFFAVGGGPDQALLALMAGFAGLLGLDALFARWGLAPAWWMRLRLILTAGVLACLAASARAEGAEVTLHARSGTVAPAHAWAWDVTFGADGSVVTRFCKGYADAEPGCASRTDRLDPPRLQALKALLATLTPAPEDPNPPIGGGARWAEAGTLTLPAHPLPADAPRVTAALDALQAFVPEGALDDTSARAKAP